MRVSCGFLEHAHPHLAAARDEPRHRDARRFDLAIGQPARLERFQTEVAERHVGSAPRFAGHAAALLFAVLHFLRHQHLLISRGAPPPLADALAPQRSGVSRTERRSGRSPRHADAFGP